MSQDALGSSWLLLAPLGSGTLLVLFGPSMLLLGSSWLLLAHLGSSKGMRAKVLSSPGQARKSQAEPAPGRDRKSQGKGGAASNQGALGKGGARRRYEEPSGARNRQEP